MAEVVQLMIQPRQGRGTHRARQLRRKGLVPAVLYGHQEATLSVALAHDDLYKAIRHGARVVDLKSGDKVEKALIRDLQWDHLGKDIVHVDFYRISADERVVVTVPLKLHGTAPGIAAGGVLDQPIHSLEIECLAIALPDAIRVNIGEMQIGSVIHVRDLVLPAGVKAMADPDGVVIQLRAKEAAEEAAPVAAAEAGAAEPEVIGRKEKPAEEEAE
jgi:large subunit ribosomal protein L25